MSTRKCAPLDQIPLALAKTGFLLEFKVAEAFRKFGWNVINSRYYVDDVDGKSRELDLVAYDVKKTKQLEVVTVALVSCKKDADQTWAFMTKAPPKNDPNIDWEPVHYWTDEEPLESYLANSDWKSSYVRGDSKLHKKLFQVTSDVFAFQCISPDGKSPKNNTPIFDAVSGLLKALDFEVQAVPNRAKGRKRVYIFYPVVVVDAPLVDVRYESKGISAGEVDRLLHLARYMVRKREFSALVHFVRSDTIESFIGEVGQLAKYNVKKIDDLVDQSFAAITHNSAVQNYFADRLIRRVRWHLNRELKDNNDGQEVSSMEISFSKDCLMLELDVEPKIARSLNHDSRVRDFVAKALKDIARFTGKFEISSQFPF